MVPPASSAATAIELDHDSDATLSSDSDVDMERSASPRGEARAETPAVSTATPTKSTAATTATFSDSMAAARGNLLSAASMGLAGAAKAASPLAPAAARTHAVASVSTPNGKKRRLSSPPPPFRSSSATGDGKPRASLDFRLAHAARRTDRSMQFIDEDEDSEEEETKSERVSNGVSGPYEDRQQHGVVSVPRASSLGGVMNRVESIRTWICGQWFGKCVLEFHAVYVKFWLSSLPTSDGTIKCEFSGSIQSRQLERFALSRGPAPYFAILEFSRRVDCEPTFANFYDAIFARVTEREGPSVVPDVYGIVLFFDDDLELARCQSLGDLSKTFRALLDKLIPPDEEVQVKALKSEPQTSTSSQRSSTSVFSMITDKVKGTIDTISNILSSDRSPLKLRQSKIHIDATDTSDQESSAMSTRFRTSSRRKSLLQQSSRDTEVVVQLSGDTDPGSDPVTSTENGSVRRSTRGVLQLMHEQHRKETRRLATERKGKLLLSYPFEDTSRPGQITITYGDIDRLKPGEFLNDSIIDFYLRYLWRHVEDWQHDLVYFFSSHFFTQLCGGKLSGSTSLSEDRQRRVARWTQKENLFQKRFIFVPINDSCHWSIAVLCNPGSAIIQKRRRQPTRKLGSSLDDSVIVVDSTNEPVVVDTTEDASDSEEEELQQKERKQHPPCLLFLDSLRCHQKKKICTLLKSYIEYEFKTRFGDQTGDTTRNSDTIMSFDVDSISIIEPEIPLQSNSSDCGVFLLMYTAQILQRFPAGLCQDDVSSKLSSSMSNQMFDGGHVQEFRDYLHQLIFMLQKIERRGGSELAIRTEGLEFFAIEN